MTLTICCRVVSQFITRNAAEIPGQRSQLSICEHLFGTARGTPEQCITFMRRRLAYCQLLNKSRRRGTEDGPPRRYNREHRLISQRSSGIRGTRQPDRSTLELIPSKTVDASSKQRWRIQRGLGRAKHELEGIVSCCRRSFTTERVGGSLCWRGSKRRVSESYERKKKRAESGKYTATSGAL